MKRLLAAAILVPALAMPAMALEKTVTLAVSNMYCSACPYTVKSSLSSVKGVHAVKVSFEKKTATVTYDDTRANVKKLIQATENVGYPSRVLGQ